MQQFDNRSYRIQHLAEADGGGGAVMAAHKLHSELRALGLDSHMLAARKRTEDPTTVQLPLNNDYLSRLRRHFIKRKLKRRLKLYKDTKSKTLEIFTQGRGVYGSDLIRHLPDADIFVLHWSDLLIDYRSLFSHIEPKTPIVWRMPDMNAMTGGCHYAWDCERFTGTCGKCPQLGSSTENDLSRSVYEYKDGAYSKRDPNSTCFVAPSNWIAKQARRSALLRKFEIVHIPTGVDCKRFKPMDVAKTRERYGLPIDKPLVLFVAQSASNYRKGFDLLLAALRTLRNDRVFALAAIGSAIPQADLSVPCYSLGRIEDPEELAALYSAADIFVHPAREDNFPNVVLEAMACGTPCVVFDVGGLPEMVRDGDTGLVVPRESVEALRAGIVDLLSNPDRLKAMSYRCREVALAEFQLDQMAERYRDLFDTLIERINK
jgi:glycosyltransferase involved in cell wall biosynthesis